MTKTAAIYDPYLDTLGGGERYCLTVAELLIKNGWAVDLFWSGDRNIIEKASARFSLVLKGLKIQPDIFLQPEKHLACTEDTNIHSSVKTPTNISKSLKNISYRKKATRHYDVLFYLSDGSIPLLFSKKNFLHIQAPLIENHTLANKFKLSRINKCICNSNFTASFYKKYPSYKTVVIYPPVDVDKFINKQSKDNVILSVGRFDNILNSKKQDILIQAFKEIYHQNKQWKLILAGGSMVSETKNNYLNHLKYLSKNFPIELIINPSFTELTHLYQKSKIYWHAAGYGVDQVLHPEFTEHFGISVVEAMAAGCVPLVVNKGGLPEIVVSKQNGYIWENIEQLTSKTQLLINNSDLLKGLSIRAVLDSSKFSKKHFEKHLLNVINE